MAQMSMRDPQTSVMATPDASLLAILQDHFHPREDGWMWIAFYDEGDEGGVVEQIEGALSDVAGTARSLALVIDGVGCERVFIALCRKEGRPAQADRELWQRLRSLVRAEKLVDLVVFNQRSTWSMRADDQEAGAALG